MPRSGIPDPARPTLFQQIAGRLVIVTIVFALIEIAIVVPMYASDQQALAADFIDQQTHRIARAANAIPNAGLEPYRTLALTSPDGVSAWDFEVFGVDRRPILGLGRLAGPENLPWLSAETQDWTRRDHRGGATRLSGVRRFEGKSGPLWIFVSANAASDRIFWPVIAQELLAHVAVPLVPLTILLLIFNVQVVRRTLAPLEQAANEVDALDPSRMEARLSRPPASREVDALVSAVNRALDRLQQAITLLKTFTADAAHELRTPLAVLRLRIDSLPDSAVKPRLSDEVHAMTRLVNQMLDLAQADVLGMEDAGEVDLNSLAGEVVSQIAPRAFGAGHDIQLIDQGPAKVRGHADALGRALRNLIENAIHHTKGGRPIEVVVGPGGRLVVRDYGPGLPDGDADKIFDRFWRKARGQEGGAGLGLGIVRSIIEAHGGTVTARTAPDGGAEFVCSVPPAL